jgi:hypothetical protein
MSALGLVEARLLRLDVRALGLLGSRRPRVLWLLGLRVHLALLILLLVRVLGVDGGLLLGDVWGLRVLVHGNFISR